jgi:hypothetical protein
LSKVFFSTDKEKGYGSNLEKKSVHVPGMLAVLSVAYNFLSERGRFFGLSYMIGTAEASTYWTQLCGHFNLGDIFVYSLFFLQGEAVFLDPLTASRS